MKTFLSIFCSIGLSIAHAAGTCEDPTPLSRFSVSGNTSADTDNLPTLWRGAVATPGRDHVYRFTTFNAIGSFYLSSSSGYFPSLFVCRGCGVAASCFDGSGTRDANGNVVAYFSGADPDGAAIYVIVDSFTADAGGEYTLQYFGPLDAAGG